MKRREGKGPPSTDLLVCFPTRAHLTLMPKPICSPARSSDSKKNPHQSHQQVLRRHHRLRRSTNRSIGGSSGGHGSPYLWSKTKQMGSDISEPTSPKVTCAGQIKVRPRPGPCKNWQSVMEEIERLHKNRKQKKSTWVEALGFKKEVVQFLTCLKSIKFDFGCFRAFPGADITSDDEEEEEDDDDKDIGQGKKLMGMGNYDQDHEEEEGSSKTMFSKWFMLLQENQDCVGKGEGRLKLKEVEVEKASDDHEGPPCVPPANALLLMRCRSAPAKSWMEEKQEEEDEDEDGNEDDDDDEEEEKEEEKKEEEKEKKRESLMDLMRYETDFYKLSCDIAKETWVVGGINKDPFSRSRSWKR